MTATTMQSFINGMPKCELHIHLEGCMTPQLMEKLAERNKMSLPDTVEKALTPDGFMYHDLTSLLAIYGPAMEVLQTAEDFHDLAIEYLNVAHRHNVKHCELFFDPQAHTSRGVSFSTVVSGYRSGLLEAQRRFGISASLIMCFMKELSAEFAMATLMEALPYKDSIIGVGLDSDQQNNPPNKFAAVFARAKQEGFLLTAHCDVDGDNTLEHIRQCVEDIQVDRIDHGTNIVENPKLVELAKTKVIGLTCCPISNLVVAKDLKGKEITNLLRQGVKVTISSDDPGYLQGYANENISRLALETDLTKDELIQLQRNAFEISWISSSKRDQLLSVLEDYPQNSGIA